MRKYSAASRGSRDDMGEYEWDIYFEVRQQTQILKEMTEVLKEILDTLKDGKGGSRGSVWR